MNATLADEPVVTFGLGRRWATSTTTVGNEVMDVSITSDPAPQRNEEVLIPILQYYAAALGALPARRGKAFFLEQPADQAGFITDTIVSSTSAPHIYASALWSSAFARRYAPPLPSRVHADEVLNWDAFIEHAPQRPSGTLKVTLKYAGRGTPTPVEDPWD